ncbi:MAG TPA: DUF1800 domain-containing protein [Terracidiphilus sp.]|nr:DUF1800 domain-containing protein [Terracidiphilus sp.]
MSRISMESLRSPLAVFLCCTLCASIPMGYAQQAPEPRNQPTTTSRERTEYKSTQLQGDERILHALNRFTFGPRPDDLETVRATGLDKWFDQQLHPASIDQTDLNARLAQFPAMQWTTAQLLYYLPGNAIIRQAMNGKAPVPESGVLHAIYENQIDRLQTRKVQQATKNEPGAANTQKANLQLASDGTMMSAEAPTMDQSADTSPNPSMSPSAQTDMTAESANTQLQFDPSSIAPILALPPAQRITQLAAMQPQEFQGFIKSLRPVQRVALNDGLTPGQKQTIGALENPERLVAEELIAQRLTRDIYSSAQLQEVMTDFWFNHFNVYLRKNEQMPYYLVSYERDTIRPRSLGKFEDLLEAVAHSPAMLVYLDNAGSIGPDSLAAQRADMAAARRPGPKNKVHEGLNENYARELMELHTLGVNGGYTQADVTQVARVLTGWTIDRPLLGGDFTFNPNRHEPGSKKVLGKKFKDNGEKEGRELLHMLASSPATAQFISRKLAIRFVSDDPPQTLVDRMAKSYLSSGGDIAVVLKTLFHSPEFWSTSTYRAKVKTPLEFVVSAVRASNASIDNLLPLANNLRQMGMPLYGAIPPTGYDWKSSTWVSTSALVDRMNFALNLAANRLPGITVTWTPLPDRASTTPAPTSTPESEETRLEPLLVAGGISASTRSAALQQFEAQSAQNNAQNSASATPVSAGRRINRTPNAAALERQDQLLAGLLLGSPEFQRR